MNPLPLGAGLLVLAGSAALLVRSLKSLAAARASVAWPSTDGHVESSEAVQFKSASRHRTLFVTYRYTVGGTEHTGTRAAFYTLLGDEVVALDRRLHASPTVRVSYDPAAPSESTLVVGPRSEKPYSDVSLAALGGVVGIALALAAAAGVVG